MVLNKIPSFQEIKDWVNNNADVPNADYADDAGTLGGSSPSNYTNHINPTYDSDGNGIVDLAELADGLNTTLPWSDINNPPITTSYQTIGMRGSNDDGSYSKNKGYNDFTHTFDITNRRNDGGIYADGVEVNNNSYINGAEVEYVDGTIESLNPGNKNSITPGMVAKIRYFGNTSGNTSTDVSFFYRLKTIQFTGQ
jgi:hypothetical protein